MCKNDTILVLLVVGFPWLSTGAYIFKLFISAIDIIETLLLDLFSQQSTVFSVRLVLNSFENKRRPGSLKFGVAVSCCCISFWYALLYIYVFCAVILYL